MPIGTGINLSKILGVTKILREHKVTITNEKWVLLIYWGVAPKVYAYANRSTPTF